MEPQKASPISKMDGIRLQSTLLPFWTCISTSGIVKMMMKNVASKSNLALTRFKSPFTNAPKTSTNVNSVDSTHDLLLFFKHV